MKFTVNLGQIPCIRASIFTLKGREGRAYKLLCEPPSVGEVGLNTGRN